MIVKMFMTDNEDPNIFQFMEKSIIIGRGDQAEICVNEKSVSRKHLSVYVDRGKIKIIDLASSNGTRVNQIQIKSNQQIQINESTKIQIAQLPGFICISLRQQEERERSKDNKKDISDSTLRMLKEMTQSHKSKQQKIKFLKLMGYNKAEEYLKDLQQKMKSKNFFKIDAKKISRDLEKQFLSSKGTNQKKGLGIS